MRIVLFSLRKIKYSANSIPMILMKTLAKNRKSIFYTINGRADMALGEQETFYSLAATNNLCLLAIADIQS